MSHGRGAYGGGWGEMAVRRAGDPTTTQTQTSRVPFRTRTRVRVPTSGRGLRVYYGRNATRVPAVPAAYGGYSRVRRAGGRPVITGKPRTALVSRRPSIGIDQTNATPEKR